MKRILRKILKITAIVLGSLVLLFVLLFFLIRIPFIQTYIVRQITNYYSHKLHTEIRIGRVNIEFFSNIVLEDVLIKDQHGDTLLSAGKLKAHFALFKFFSKNFNIDKVELDHADIYMHRPQKDSVFNYQFIVDAFAPTDTTPSTGNTKLALKDFTFKKIRFRYFDDKNFLHVSVNLPSAEINGETIDIVKSRIVLKKIGLESPDVTVRLMAYERDTIPFIPDTAVSHINTKGFYLLTKSFSLKEGQFKYVDENVVPFGKGFDPAHMDFSKINIDLEQAGITGDQIVADSKHLSAKEKSGMELRNLTGQIEITPYESSIRHLFLETGNSRITDYVAMHYPTLRAFYDFNHQVFIEADLKKAKVSFKDISYFSSGIDAVEKPLIVSGKITGTVADFKARDLMVNGGEGSFIDVKADIGGLPDIHNTSVNLIINKLHTNYQDLHSIMPGLNLPVILSQLGNVDFHGELTGFLQDFVAYGTIETSIGKILPDVNMKFSDDFTNASYSGHIELEQFDVGKFSQEENMLGLVSFVGDINGSGFTLEELDASVKGEFGLFDLNHYRYRNITLDSGIFVNRVFNGNLNVRDSNVLLSFHGNVDMSKPLYHYHFTAQIDSANLRPLHFSNSDYIFSSTLDINLSGNNIDNVAGEANVTKTVFIEGRQKFLIDTIYLNISEYAGAKHLVLHSDIVDAHLDGKFRIDALYPATLSILKYYLPSLPIRMDTIVPEQNFTFSVTVKDADPFLLFFYPQFKGLSHATVTNGMINSSAKILNLDAQVPYFFYNSIDYRQINMHVYSEKNNLYETIHAATVKLSDSIMLVDPSIESQLFNNQASFVIHSRDSTHRNELLLSGNIFATNDSLRLQFNTNKIMLDTKNWTLQENSYIVYGNNKLTVRNLGLMQGNQSIKIYTISTPNTDVKAEITEVNLEDFFRILSFTGYDISGTMNGTVLVKSLFNKPFMIANATITEFKFNLDPIGNLLVNSNYDEQAQRLNVDLRVTGPNDVRINGYFLPLQKENSLHFDAQIVSANLSVMNKYVKDYITNVKGQVGGKLKIGGSLKKPDLTGSITIFKAALNVNYLGTRYFINSDSIAFNDGFIDLGSFIVRDTFGGRAELAGGIIHNHLHDFNLNMFVTVLPNDEGDEKFFALNTTSKDNPLYYGTAFIKGAIQFKGTLDNLLIDASSIRTVPGVQMGLKKLGTHLSIPISYSEGVAQYDFIHFINSPDSLNSRSVNYVKSGLRVNLNLDITDDAEISIIFNQRSGDIINGIGKGNIRMEIDTKGEFNMYGNYTISKGSYLFTLQDYFNTKYFVIQNGGTIVWSGNPYEAQINIDAIYTTHASLNGLGDALISNPQPEEVKLLQKKIAVYVYMNLAGSLLHPAIAFDIKIPESNSLSSLIGDPMSRIRQDENELNKQVFGLLVMGRFLPLGSGTTGPGSFASSINSTVTEFLSNYISYILSQNKLGVGVNINYDANTTEGITPEDINKLNELYVALTKSFLNDKITLEVGGNLEVTNNATTSANNIAGDFQVYYKLTPDGRYVLTVFSKSEYDYINERNHNRTGVGISYRREFDKFLDLFHGKNK